MPFSLFWALIFVASAHARTCPSGCSCSSRTITCNGLSVFPDFNFPKVTTVRISRSNCSIPENAFAKLSSLRTIGISRSNISTVGSCAFAGLDLQDLTMSYCNITVISPGAFSNLNVTNRLKIERSQIQKISSNAFNKMRRGNYLEIRYSEITTIQPFSFNDVEVRYFKFDNCKITTLEKFAFSVASPNSQMSSSTIMNIGCRTLETLTPRPYGLTLRCDCDLIPAIKAKRFNNPIKCLKDSELSGARPGFGTDCSTPIIPAPPQCRRIRQGRNGNATTH